MKLTPDNEPAIAGLEIAATDEELVRLAGKWVVIDGDGKVKAVGADFDEVHRAAQQANLDLSKVEFACLPKPGLIA